jgi:hypothetical protein
MQHSFPGAGGDDQAGSPQRFRVSRHGGSADAEFAGQLGGGALAAGEAQHGGAGVAEQFADWIAGRPVYQREWGKRRVDDDRRPVGMRADHRAPGPQHRGQQRDASAAGVEFGQPVAVRPGQRAEKGAGEADILAQHVGGGVHQLKPVGRATAIPPSGVEDLLHQPEKPEPPVANRGDWLARLDSVPELPGQRRIERRQRGHPPTCAHQQAFQRCRRGRSAQLRHRQARSSRHGRGRRRRRTASPRE